MTKKDTPKTNEELKNVAGGAARTNPSTDAQSPDGSQQLPPPGVDPQLSDQDLDNATAGLAAHTMKSAQPDQSDSAGGSVDPQLSDQDLDNVASAAAPPGAGAVQQHPGAIDGGGSQPPSDPGTQDTDTTGDRTT